MTKLPENNLIVKICNQDWTIAYPQNLSASAREILLTINCYIFFSKKDPKEFYWSEIEIASFLELTALSKDQLHTAFKELISKRILIQKSRCILTLARRER